MNASPPHRLPCRACLVVAALCALSMPASLRADEATCAEIQRVRALAQHHALSADSLDALALVYCGDSSAHEDTAMDLRIVAEGSADCQDLVMIALLAAATSELDAGQLKAIQAQRRVSCSTRSQDAVSEWPNGRTARYSDGSWQYPNGRTARYSDGSWQYPNGHTARYSDGSWQYPNGRTARYSDGSWQDPDGRSADGLAALLARACQATSQAACDTALRSLDEVDGELEVAVVVTFVSRALGR